MTVENDIIDTRLNVISAQEGITKIAQGEHVLSPNIHVSTEKWDGGHTYITITFYDYYTSQSVIVLKSSGIGLTISHDQSIAIAAIRKKIKEIFGERDNSKLVRSRIFGAY